MDTLNIVTVVKNDYVSLSLTINSIFSLAQKLPKVKFFHHIQDGGNADQKKFFTCILSKIRPISNLKIIYSQCPDSGIFDAMNKVTIKFTVGDLVLFMNAGDTFSKKINFKMLLFAIRDFKNRKETICFFRSKNYYNDIFYFMPPKNIKSTLKFKDWLQSHTPVHQAVIFKCSDLYPLKYSNLFKIQADSFLIFSILTKFSEPIFYDIDFCDFNLGGYSGDYKSFRKVTIHLREQLRLMSLRKQSTYLMFLTTLIFFVKYFLHNLFKEKFIYLHARVNQLIKN
jgi:hypothetical protein